MVPLSIHEHTIPFSWSSHRMNCAINLVKSAWARHCRDSQSSTAIGQNHYSGVTLPLDFSIHSITAFLSQTCRATVSCPCIFVPLPSARPRKCEMSGSDLPECNNRNNFDFIGGEDQSKITENNIVDIIRK